MFVLYVILTMLAVLGALVILVNLYDSLRGEKDVNR